MQTEPTIFERLPFRRSPVSTGRAMPRDPSPESTPALLAEGYKFISNRCQRFGSDIFECRLLLQRTICMRGEEAARLFYDGERFQRTGAVPLMLQKTLLGVGSVQGLDDDAHRHRKHMFMQLMSQGAIERLVGLMRDAWHADLVHWQQADRVVLHEAVERVLCRAVCAWAGVPLEPAEIDRRTSDLAQLIDGAGSAGPRHFKARWARKRCESWIANIVDRFRAGKLALDPACPVRVVAEHRELDGRLLTARVAAVEILNLLRPTVAIAWFITFAALALHEHRDHRETLRTADDAALENFVHEVRRYYAFFPAVPARVRQDFEWNGHHFPKGTRTLLDLYGTNRDPRVWTEPDAFRPARFAERAINPFNFIPQGGGDTFAGHRCAGERVTIAIMKEAVRLLTQEMQYDVPDQDLRIDWSRMPTIPNSRFAIANVRAAMGVPLLAE